MSFDSAFSWILYQTHMILADTQKYHTTFQRKSSLSFHPHLKTLLWIHGYPSCVSQSNAKQVSWAFLLLATNSKISRFCKEKKEKNEAKYRLKGSFYEQIEYVPLSATFELQKTNNKGFCISLPPVGIETKLQNFSTSPVLSSGGRWQSLLSPAVGLSTHELSQRRGLMY